MLNRRTELADRNNFQYLRDPIQFGRALWPDVYFYSNQREFFYSILKNFETDCCAANKMGKDFGLGFMMVFLFCTRHPCRIVTTSAKDDHLDVLWGEAGRFITTSRIPLTVDKGGILIHNDRELKKVIRGVECPISYVKGMVAAPDRMAAMQGHHVAETGDDIPRAFFFGDEASGLPKAYRKNVDSWAHRIALIGNAWQGENEWEDIVEGGDVVDPTDSSKLLRKVMRWTVEDSPNVRLARAEQAAGKDPSYRFIVKGVKGYREYERNLKMWDDEEKAVKLFAQFYKGASIMLYPRDWLDRAARYAVELRERNVSRFVRALGIDTGEGSANTSWTGVDEYGISSHLAFPTPDTSVIIPITIDLIHTHNIPPEYVCFDRGGGGKQFADKMRSMGYPVRTVSFGEPAGVLDVKRSTVREGYPDRLHSREARYEYKNRRAEMFGQLSVALDPSWNPAGFAIPAEYKAFRDQLSPIPKKYEEGRLWLPPKNKKDSNSKEVTLVDLIGHSPDEADSLVVALWSYENPPVIVRAGVTSDMD